MGLGMAGRAGGWLRVGQAFGVLLLPGLGSAAPGPKFLGTQPPHATQALNSYKTDDCVIIIKLKI